MNPDIFYLAPFDENEFIHVNLLTNPNWKTSAFCRSCRQLSNPTLLQWLTCETPETNVSGFLSASSFHVTALHCDMAEKLSPFLKHFYWVGFQNDGLKFVKDWLGIVAMDQAIIRLAADPAIEECSCCGKVEHLNVYDDHEAVYTAKSVENLELGFTAYHGLVFNEKIKEFLEDWLKNDCPYRFGIGKVNIADSGGQPK
ncbi:MULTISPECIES: hypothetical protein [Thalassoglobus]|uniref:Uncharacterized protein n=1 Tax=Thalassoglobus polymorphus TaxID=2527994 RepID=A0A517QTY8_9PLAN|nr:hypothetical protein [Thalassoglobus polymorphus]QDT35017.1 hypothetical protein Mal48_42900 [Thalassoglobus polymorphus]